MSLENDDLPDIPAKLQSLVEASSTAPPWRDAWAELGPQSTDEQRLAVYQAIRDSGYLFEEEGLYLVAQQVEEMADGGAGAKLRDMESRMEAIEQEYGVLEGDPWPDGQPPPEYEALAGQYQDALDKVFLARLEACGEREIAELYQTNPDEFTRRYEIGLDCFQALIDDDPDALVTVASCLDPPRADLAQMALARDGIPASPGNANFLGWYWQYSNATGGVTIDVRRGDARRACHVLATAPARFTESLRPWTCPACGQQIAGQWDACWHCGRFADGGPESTPAETVGPLPEGDAGPGVWWRLSQLFLITLCAMLLIRLRIWIHAQPISLLSFPLLLSLAFVVLFVVLLLQFEFSPDSSEPEAEPDDASSRNTTATRSVISHAIVMRAWQAAVIALSFPPLAFYALRLVWKIPWSKTPLGAGDRWRAWLAVPISMIAILYGLIFFWIWLPVAAVFLLLAIRRE